uniref:Type-1 angiotensin II receptor n=1 Tax=Callorhinchus milii TaxID=7868 RepID=A0A4W3I5R3_CALMI
MEHNLLNDSMGNASQGEAQSCVLGGRHDYIFLLIPITYSVIFVVGVIGNGLVVIVIYCYLKVITVANIFLLNLALADLIFIITLPVWAAYTAMGYHWPFGGFLCKMCSTFVLINMNASIFLVTCLSIDRYLAIVHPMRSRSKRTLIQARVVCTVVWLLAAVTSLPNTFLRDTVSYESWNKTICAFQYPERHKEQWIFGMALLKILLGFLIPSFIILTCYFLILRSLMQAYHITRSKQTNNEAFKVILAVVIMFLFCWLPYQIITFFDVLFRLNVIQNCYFSEMIDSSIPFTICLAYSNSCLNPILYGFVGHNFREKLFLLLRCLPPGIKSHSSLTIKMSNLSSRTVESMSLTISQPI